MRNAGRSYRGRVLNPGAERASANIIFFSDGLLRSVIISEYETRLKCDEVRGPLVHFLELSAGLFCFVFFFYLTCFRNLGSSIQDDL